MPSLRCAPPDHSSTHDNINNNNNNDNKSADDVEVDQRNPVRSQGALSNSPKKADDPSAVHYL